MQGMDNLSDEDYATAAQAASRLRFEYPVAGKGSDGSSIAGTPSGDDTALRLVPVRLVLVWRIDRWGCSVTDLLATLEALEHLGVGFVSLTETLDLTTPSGRAMARPRLMTFGYRDAVDIFVNGQKVFQRDATYISRDIQFLGTVSMRGAMAPRLKKDANQVGVKVK